ncbi:unnamed protein product [Spirodela intermedia]|uniref:Uncharacterized protein n=1 Tax=Spirodela intermedia TaxID=51605 RepID=A0A7I8JGF8_SPIIN|nr:unnamed protein product [Spirodela intermedia]CAA6668845.1 unnamed protein product [Spirodela intermedia]
MNFFRPFSPPGKPPVSPSSSFSKAPSPAPMAGAGEAVGVGGGAGSPPEAGGGSLRNFWRPSSPRPKT